jgi:hypothetical protein
MILALPQLSMLFKILTMYRVSHTKNIHQPPVLNRLMIFIKVLVIACLHVMCSPVVHAQTRFEWPEYDTTYLDRYRKSVTACIVLVGRMKHDLEAKSSVWIDTMPGKPGENLQPLPQPVVEFAQRCSQGFKSTEIPLPAWRHAIQLFLLANRDEDAHHLAERRLAQVADTAKQTRVHVIDTIVSLYASAQPVRLADAEVWIEKVMRSGTVATWEMQAKLGGGLHLLAKAAGDDIRATRWAQRMLTLRDSLSDNERRRYDISDAETSVALMLYWAYVNRAVLIDSLKRSPAAYASLIQKEWARRTGEKNDALTFRYPIGLRAPKIEADYWLPNSADTVHPAPGKPALVVFLEQGCPNKCWELYGVLRRLTQAFPMLDLTIVAQTKGYYGFLPPPKPSDEVALIQQWVEMQKVPATLAVTITPFWRLPNPDRRRINQITSTLEKYNFSGFIGGNTAYTGISYLIAPDGTIVHMLGVSRYNEMEYVGLLSILTQSVKSQ